MVLEQRLVADDPSALAALRLGPILTQDRVAREIADAIAADDETLARSFVTLADSRGISIEPAQRAAVAALEQNSASRAAGAFASGFLRGDTETLPALAGAVTGDVVGYGDLRDLWGEGQKLAAGESVDEVVVALAAFGITLSAATWATIGAALPARGGLTTLKAARRAGRLTAPMSASLRRMAGEAVDGNSARAALVAAGRFDLQGTRLALRGAVRPAALSRIGSLADDAAALYARTGQRGVMQALALAENANDVRRAARLATGHGASARAILKLLGRGALVIGAIGATLLGWLITAIGWIFGIAILARAFGLWLGRRIWPRPVARHQSGSFEPTASSRNHDRITAKSRQEARESLRAMWTRTVA
jgi:outer membrane lipoprotein SlyB